MKAKLIQTEGIWKEAVIDTEQGYLRNRSDWTPEFVEAMAKEDGCTLTNDHWEIINYLHKYYEENNIAPSYRVFYKVMGEKLAREDDIQEYMQQLFPNGLPVQACRYAGLHQPTGDDFVGLYDDSKPFRILLWTVFVSMPVLWVVFTSLLVWLIWSYGD